MMNKDAQIETAVTANQIPTASRINALSRHFGRHMMAVETVVFACMRELVEAYQGGYWEFYDLSNGGFYMAPGDQSETYHISCAGNWYEGTMSADAAGIVACLVAFNRMAWHTREDRFTDFFYALREWVAEHPESAEIFRAID